MNSSVYHNEHVPMAEAKLAGKTKIVTTKVLGSPQKTTAFHRIAEVHFPSMGVQACAASEGGRQVPGTPCVDFQRSTASLRFRQIAKLELVPVFLL